jgi:hypothetical protein
MTVQKHGKENEGAGDGSAMEQRLNRHLANGIFFFLSMLALLVMAAAVIGAVEVAYHDMPKLWSGGDEYAALHQLLQKVLLIAIAAELGLLLLFHRPSAALEVVMFVIARRMVATDVSPLDLLVGSAALAGLLVVRFYFLPGEPD